MRDRYNQQLEQLNQDMALLGSYCENAIASCTRALLDGNIELAHELIENAGRIDELERHIVSSCIRLILQQQPVAGDLREVSSAMKMVTDMKRICDQSADIAEIAAMANIPGGSSLPDIHAMALCTIKMVSDSVHAYLHKDLEMARAVIAYDDVVDAHFDTIKKKLIELFGKPELAGEYAIDILMSAKYYERIGDHAENIARWVLYSITGVRD